MLYICVLFINNPMRGTIIRYIVAYYGTYVYICGGMYCGNLSIQIAA